MSVGKEILVGIFTVLFVLGIIVGPALIEDGYILGPNINIDQEVEIDNPFYIVRTEIDIWYKGNLILWDVLRDKTLNCSDIGWIKEKQMEEVLKLENEVDEMIECIKNS